MKIYNYIPFFLLLLFFVSAIAQPRVVTDFNKGWQFILNTDTSASSWRTLDLPHDWSIEGKFSESNPSTTQGGALPGGIGWYKKTFTIPASAADKDVLITFDGVYRNSEVWINGQYLGKRPNGYISFQYDLTKYIKRTGANLVLVKVDNSQQPNSRWYTGSGIYRNVWLTYKKTASPLIGSDIFITTHHRGKNGADINVLLQLHNQKIAGIEYLEHSIYNAEGRLVTKTKEMLAPGFSEPTRQMQSSLKLPKPNLWTIDRPYLYKLVTKIYGKELLDSVTNTFGIRYFNFDPQTGFSLNGKPTKIKGVCLHHDLGALGAAINTRAIERQLEILKAMGCNAIRTAHNPPAPELLDLCDKMGFLVMVEAFDMWKKKKNKFDYFSDFEEWHQRDLEDMVKRDRNHPSVFMWSIGNEIREQFDSTGISITKELVSIVKSLDTTRPVTAALSEWNPEKNFMYKAGALDVIGLNYHHEVYEDFQKHYPGQAFLGAENMSALATRGHYDLPSDSTYFWPARSPQRYVEKGNPDYTVSAYDQVAAYWGSTHEQTWKIIKKHDYMSGLFVWTGFDYLGEPTPYPWPARSSYFGIIDLAGFPKDVYYMYQSEWTTKPVLHLFPHWSFRTAGQLVDIWAYYNNADEAELFLNGKSLGIRKKGAEDLHVMWRVPFQPGTLKIVSRKNGKTVLTRQVSTAGKPARIELLADRKVLKADGKDLSFVTVRILDKNGNLVPDSDLLLNFTISGTGALEATDNGYQADTTSFSSPDRKCWKGMALGIVKSYQKKGNITLTVSAPDLPKAFLTLKTSN